MSRTNAATKQVARGLSWSIALLLVLLPFHTLLTTWLGSHFGHLDLLRIWKEILIAAMFPLVLWLSLQPGFRRRFWRDRLVWLCLLYVGLFIALGVVALARHQVNRPALIYSWLSNGRFIVFMPMVMVVAVADDWLHRHWLKLLLGPATIVIIFGLLQRLVLPLDWLRHVGYGPKTIPAYQTVDQKIEYRRIQSTLRGANPLGAYLVLVLSAAMAQVWRQRLRLFAIGLLLGGLLVLGATYSRSAWLAVILCAGLLVWWQYPSAMVRRWLVMAATVVLAIGVGGLLIERHNQVLQNTFFHTDSTSLSPQSSNAGRAMAIKQAFKEAIHEPLGRGPGTAGPASFRNNHPPRIAENYYLQLAQEVGWLGLGLFVLINVMVGWRLWLRRHNTLALVLFTSLIGLSLVNLLSHAWADDTLGLVWWGLAGIALAPILNKKRKAA